MTVSNLFSRGQFKDLGGVSYTDLKWNPLRNAVGTEIDTKAQRKRVLIDEAESAAKTGNSAYAVIVLSRLELPAGSYERQLYLNAATNAQDWEAILKVTDPPATIDELLQRFEAFSKLGNPDGAISALDQFSQQLQLPESLTLELRHWARAQEIMRR